MTKLDKNRINFVVYVITKERSLSFSLGTDKMSDCQHIEVVQDKKGTPLYVKATKHPDENGNNVVDIIIPMENISNIECNFTLYQEIREAITGYPKPSAYQF